MHHLCTKDRIVAAAAAEICSTDKSGVTTLPKRHKSGASRLGTAIVETAPEKPALRVLEDSTRHTESTQFY